MILCSSIRKSPQGYGYVGPYLYIHGLFYTAYKRAKIPYHLARLGLILQGRPLRGGWSRIPIAIGDTNVPDP